MTHLEKKLGVAVNNLVTGVTSSVTKLEENIFALMGKLDAQDMTERKKLQN